MLIISKLLWPTSILEFALFSESCECRRIQNSAAYSVGKKNPQGNGENSRMAIRGTPLSSFINQLLARTRSGL